MWWFNLVTAQTVYSKVAEEILNVFVSTWSLLVNRIFIDAVIF
ncbi:TPA: hypothetical protein ACK0FE_001985 [Staphylococcus aureus]